MSGRLGLLDTTKALLSPKSNYQHHARARSAERSLHDTFDLDDNHDLPAKNDQNQKQKNEKLLESCIEDVDAAHQDRPQRRRLESDNSVSNQLHHLVLRRVNSDPFDNAGSNDGDNNHKNDEDLALPISANHRSSPRMNVGAMDDSSNALPTLNRFPFAETKNRNCWSDPPPHIFMVRGRNYLEDKKKCSCQSFLLQGRGVDLFLSDHPGSVDMSKLKGALGGNFRKKPSFLVRFIFPWGLLILHFEVPDKLRPFLQMHGGGAQQPSLDSMMKDLSIPERTLAKWFAGSTDYKNDRLKLIAYVPEGPWIVRNMVTGRPAIIGKKLPVSYQYVHKQGGRAEFLSCDLGIASSKPAAKRIVSVCRRYMSSLSVDIGFVVEGTCTEDLPEEMFGALRIHQADPSRSPTV